MAERGMPEGIDEVTKSYGIREKAEDIVAFQEFLGLVEKIPRIQELHTRLKEIPAAMEQFLQDPNITSDKRKWVEGTFDKLQRALQSAITDPSADRIRDVEGRLREIESRLEYMNTQ